MWRIRLPIQRRLRLRFLPPAPPSPRSPLIIPSQDSVRDASPTAEPCRKDSGFVGRWISSSSSPCSLRSSALRCWKCGAEEPFLACGHCGAVQPVDSAVDFFRIFGLERVYDIEDGNLESKYKDWQKKLHPDLVHMKSDEEKAFAAEQSARVIDAFRTLLKPLSRALYLLKLEGIPVDEEKTVSEPSLLVEMMEIREAVEEANSSQTLKEIESEITKKLETWSSSFHEAFRNKDFDRAVACTERMRYYNRALEEIVKKL